MNQLEEAASWQRAWRMLEHGTSAGVKKSWDTRRRGRHPEQPSHEPRNPRDAFSPDDPAIRAGTAAATMWAAAPEDLYPRNVVADATAQHLGPDNWVAQNIAYIQSIWAGAPNNDTSFAIKGAVSDIWGGDVWRNGKKLSRAVKTPEAESFKTYAKIQYAATQEYLKSQGVGDTVTLYRGIKTDDIPPSGARIDQSFGALSSFSLSKDVAARFGNVLTKIEVPREYVFSQFDVGPGMIREREVLVLGDHRTFKAKVIKSGPVRPLHTSKEAQPPTPHGDGNGNRDGYSVEIDADDDNRNWLHIVAQRRLNAVQILKRMADKLQKLM